MRILGEITIPTISPQSLEHAQHVLDNDTKYRDYEIRVLEIIYERN